MNTLDASMDDTDIARRMAARCAVVSRPTTPQLHLLDASSLPRLFVTNGSRLYDLTADTAARIRSVVESGVSADVDQLMIDLGLDTTQYIDDQPLKNPPVHALSLAVAQKCNLGCTYCYARQGTFGGTAKVMSAEIARQSVDLLMDGKPPGSRVNLAFLGGEPLANRTVIRDATLYAVRVATEKGLEVRFSITTNGTLLTREDGDFFEEHGFAVTVSLDGIGEEHDLLRPFRTGAGSYHRIIERVEPLLAIQRKMQISARVTVTPSNINLPGTLDELIKLGFHSVGFSPLLRSSSGLDEMDATSLQRMLEGLIACGMVFERRLLAKERYPFLNMVNALRELQKGTHRPYPCGAGAGYFGVSADGDLAACHRFVDDEQGAMGNLTTGVDSSVRDTWLADRHVNRQEPCRNCWARYLCGGGCHHEVIAKGRPACDFIRGWLHYTIEAHCRLSRLVPSYFDNENNERFGEESI